MKNSLLWGALATAVVGLATSAAFAQGNSGQENPYSPQANGHQYRHGALATRETLAKMQAWEHSHAAGFAAPTASTGKLSYGGGVGGVGVGSGQVQVYLVFYGTQWGTQSGSDPVTTSGYYAFSGDASGAAGAVQKMFKGIGTNGELWQADLTQWCEGIASGATDCSSRPASSFVPYQQNILAGVWYDNSAASPSAATGTQLAQEAVKAAAHFGRTATGSNRYTYYVILSPHGTNPDNYQSPTQGYCAWHDYTGDGYGVTAPGGDIAFSNQPYNMDVGSSCGVGFVNSPGTLDGYTMTLGHEWHEMMSDQFPAGGWTNHTGGTYNGQENSDECAWIAAGSAGGAANIAFSTGTFTEQASWSNDTGACAISHPIVNHGGGGDTTPPTVSASESGTSGTITLSATASDNVGVSKVEFYVDGSLKGTDTTSAYSMSLDSTTLSNASHSLVAKAYDAAGNVGTSSTVNFTISNSGGGGGSTLTNGVGITISDATVNHQQNWTMAVPAGATNLVFTLSGGTGDADLYVKFGSAPTTSSYDCRPYVSGNSETCNIATAQAGTYYVMVNAYAAYSGVTLKGSYSASSGDTTPPTVSASESGTSGTITLSATASDNVGVSKVEFYVDGTLKGTDTSSPYSMTLDSTTLSNASHSLVAKAYDAANNVGTSSTVNFTISNSGGGGGSTLTNGVGITISDATVNHQQNWTMAVPSGATNLVFTLSGGTGDADLYVKFGSAPTTSSYDCRPYVSGNNETCTISSAQAGTYYVMVNTYAAYSGVTLKGSYSTGGGGGGCTPSGSVLCSGSTVTGLSASTGNFGTIYSIAVPSGSTKLTVAITGSSGDADLYVRLGSAPTTSSYTCRPYLSGDNETCTINSPTAGTYYIGVRAYSTYSGVTLTTTIQ